MNIKKKTIGIVIIVVIIVVMLVIASIIYSPKPGTAKVYINNRSVFGVYYKIYIDGELEKEGYAEKITPGEGMLFIGEWDDVKEVEIEVNGVKETHTMNGDQDVKFTITSNRMAEGGIEIHVDT